MSAVRILWIDLRRKPDGPAIAAGLPSRCKVTRVDHMACATEAARRMHPDLACAEFDYPDEPHLRVVPRMIAAFPSLPLLMFTEYHSEALALWAFRSGVRDYRVKPVDAKILASLIRRFAANGVGVQGMADAMPMPPELARPGEHLLSPSVTSVRTAAAMTYIAAHFGEEIRQGKLASLCHLSPSEFSRVFRREHGTTFERFLLEFRIAKARDLLLKSRLTITQVAHAVGFTDSSYFARVFRKFVGVTASDWRQRGSDDSPSHAA